MNDIFNINVHIKCSYFYTYQTTQTSAFLISSGIPLVLTDVKMLYVIHRTIQFKNRIIFYTLAYIFILYEEYMA